MAEVSIEALKEVIRRQVAAMLGLALLRSQTRGDSLLCCIKAQWTGPRRLADSINEHWERTATG